MKRLQDPRVWGFLAGFTGVILLGLIFMTVTGLLSGSSPAPTLAPSADEVAARVTVAPTSSPLTGETTVPTAQPSPSPSEPAAPTPTPTPSGRSEPIAYTVQPGDTLFDIALAHGVSVETIQAANDLAGETIAPDQVLIIPPGPLPTPTPYVEGDALVHTVSSGETLLGIAEHYSVSVELIQETNELDSEVIQPGWQLRIPATAVQTTATVTPTRGLDQSWQPSILQEDVEGDLEADYPLTLERDRFTLHYQPDTPAARAPNRVAELVTLALEQVEDKLQVTLEQPFDVYVAGTLFEGEDMALRGRSFSADLRNFYLYDDTGTPAERRYTIVHELTHLVAWNTIGKPASVMLHEGVAVYTGVEALETAGFIPLTHFCAAYQQTGELPSLSSRRAYGGHIRDLELYFAAGCFVNYLIQEHGLDEFKTLFTDDDYAEIYGSTLKQLEQEWLEALEVAGDGLDFEPEELVTFVDEVADAYDRLFADFQGTPSQMAAYRELDQARIAVLQGRFVEAQDHLDEFEALLE